MSYEPGLKLLSSTVVCAGSGSFVWGEEEEQKANRHRSARLDQDSCLLRLVRYYFIIYLKLAWEVQGMRMGQRLLCWFKQVGSASAQPNKVCSKPHTSPSLKAGD